MSDDTNKTEDKGMDPVVVSSLVVLATNIANLAFKYNDPNLKAPTMDAVRQHLESFKVIADLPEVYDDGFVNEIMESVSKWIEDFGK
jgi:hypothetical protein